MAADKEAVGLSRVHVLLLLSFAFTISNFVSAASAWCNSEMPPSKQVNGHSFTIMPHWLVSTAVAVARRYNPTHACCCDMVPRLFGTGLAGSIGHGAGPFPVDGW